MWLWNQTRCGRSRRQIEHGQRYLNWALTHKGNGLVPIVTATRNVYPDAVEYSTWGLLTSLAKTAAWRNCTLS